MTDSKYFTTNKKGEIFELKAELNNEKKEKRKEAAKKVIAVATVGKDTFYFDAIPFFYFCFCCLYFHGQILKKITHTSVVVLFPCIFFLVLLQFQVLCLSF
uniref:Uncharacterized protein n=1 Tax=Theropithecus gelada TaxID=9565 RepID=A0A8D2G9K3_THEGE